MSEEYGCYIVGTPDGLANMAKAKQIFIPKEHAEIIGKESPCKSCKEDRCCGEIIECSDYYKWEMEQRT